MIRLSQWLTTLTKSSDSDSLKKARKVISELRDANLRWNNQKLDDFLTERQRMLFYS
ncbi:MAG: hypothetical protein SVZ03_00950 [Spirochaetota bacterium]|nr:hypothetical protein [Spirochaetota bacterium]